MAFVVEDGSGLPNANSYASVQEADDYMTDRNNSEWAALTLTKKQGCLVSATEYIDTRWGSKLRGQRSTETQALEFPRKGCGLKSDEVPVRIKSACIQYALIASSTPLSPNPQYSESGTPLISTREKVGPIEEEYKSGENASSVTWNPYPLADSLMQSFIWVTGGRLYR